MNKTEARRLRRKLVLILQEHEAQIRVFQQCIADIKVTIKVLEESQKELPKIQFRVVG